MAVTGGGREGQENQEESDAGIEAVSANISPAVSVAETLKERGLPLETE